MSQSNEGLVYEWPDTLAEYASEDGWIAYKWIQILSEIITPLILAGNARILLSAPPQHGKSEFFSNWLPTWFLRRFQRKRVILGAYGQDYANKWGVKVRENLTHNKKCAIPMDRGTASKKKFLTKQKGYMLVAGVDGPSTGESADLFIVDDPYKNAQEAMSPTTREHVMNWFRAVATTRVQSGGSIVVMHTRWMDDDLIGELSKEEGWIYINFEALCESVDSDPMKRQLGEALCPERFTSADLIMKRREVTDLFWFPMYQGTPLNAQGAIIQADDIQYYDELPGKMDEIALFADLTYDKKEEADFSVFEAWGRKNANIYLIAQIRAQMGIHEQMDAFNRLIKLYPEAYHKEIEEKANGAAIIQLFKDKVPGIKANNPHTSKGARLAAVSPLYKSKNVYYPNPQKNPWVKQNVYEILRMTLAGSKAKNDDTVDTATMAVTHFGGLANSLEKLAALARR